MKRTLTLPSTPAVARRANQGRPGTAADLARRSVRRVGGRLGVRAFTLVELLAVIAIIGILAGITYTAVDGILDRAKRSSTRALIDSIDSGLQMFKTNFGHVPYDKDDGSGGIPDSTEDNQEYVRLWLLGLDYEGEPDGTHSDKSSRNVRKNQLWNGPYVEIRIERHLGAKDLDYYFIDSWGNPLYFEFYDPEDTSGDHRPIFNIDKWDIWSKGRDGEGTEDMADIDGANYEARRNNWKTETEHGKEINRDNVGNW